MLKKRMELKTKDITEITDDLEKKKIARVILEELPEWFEIPEGREQYIHDSAGKVFICAKEDEKPFRWGNMKIMIKRTDSIVRLGLRNLKCFRRFGMR